MKRKMIIFTAVCLTSTLLLLTGCATDPMAQCRQMIGSNPEMMQQMAKDTGTMPMMGQMQMEPEKMKQMMEKMGDNPMMAQCMNMMRTPIFPDSPCSVFALKEQLGLSEEQAKNLGAIEERARAEARKTLTEEQAKKFEVLTKDWKPMSMMEEMQTMMPQMQKMMGGQMPCPCPMCQQMQGK